MKIAYCFYGQPRSFESGIKNILNFIKNNNVDVDFYYHTFVYKEGDVMETSPWRDISKDTLVGCSDTIEKLNFLLNPVAYIAENPINFDISIYEDTIGYKNTPHVCIKNINNTLSQIYSISKVCKLFKKYNCENVNKYDLVITSRFDYIAPFNVDVNSIEKGKIYVPRVCYPRIIIPTNMWIISPEKYIKTMCVFENLVSLLNDSDVFIFMKNKNEKLYINPEEIMTATLVYNKEIDNVVYSLTNFI